MRPVLFHFLGIAVPAWHFFFAAAALAAFFSFSMFISQLNLEIPAQTASVIFAAAYVGVLGGAITWSSLVEGLGAQTSGFEPSLLAMGSFGGIIGGMVCGILAARFIGVPLWVAGDGAAVAVLLGFAVGRIGCFLNGDDYGAPVAPTLQGLGVVFPNLRDGGTLRYPVQLYESGVCIAGILMIHALRAAAGSQGRGLKAGVIASISLVWYSFARVVLENLRGDWRGPPIEFFGTNQLSLTQVVAMLMCGGGGLLLLRLRFNE